MEATRSPKLDVGKAMVGTFKITATSDSALMPDVITSHSISNVTDDLSYCYFQ